MKLNKAEKFVEAQINLGKTRNGVREAIFEKLGTWNFPPEYKDALIDHQDPFFNPDDLLDDYLNGIGHQAEAEEASFSEKKAAYLDLCPFCESEACDCDNIPELELPLSKKECFICPKGKCECKIIHLNPLPHHPGTQEWEEMVDFMRADLESNMSYSKIIELGRNIVEGQGRNFLEEFEKWKKEKKEHV